MKTNPIIYQAYREFIMNTLDEVLVETRAAINENSFYRYGNTKAKLTALENLKDDRGASHFNYLAVKGVKYHNKKISIEETELQELITFYEVNLENDEYGLFQNKNDQDKPLAYKSYLQVVSILQYCLQLQIINEAIQDLEKPLPSTDIFTPNLNIFGNPESHRFFNYLFENWLKEIPNCRPELSYIVEAMRGNIGSQMRKDYSIHCTKTDFANYWNDLQHPFKIEKDGKGKINLSTEVSDKHKTIFDSYRDYFHAEIM